MADIAAVVIQTLQWVGAPVTRQFQYLCCFSRNITSLEDEANQLEGATQDLQGKVDRAKNDLRVISCGVEIWLQNSNDIQNKTRGILYEASNVESGCSKLGARFFLSRRAKKTADRVKELRGQCNFDDDAIAQPAPAAARQPIPLRITCEFESRKQIEEDIMAALRGEGVKMMGICGMGGLGKTTMAKKIMNRAGDEKLFDEIVITVISQPVDELRIQLEIGGALGLNLTKEEAPQARVQKLNARLRGTKRILLVLDDVWESFVLENIGIPSDYKECTILLTSRNHDVLREMDVQTIGMKELSEEDSWIMFRNRVGIREDNTELNSLARKVVNKCKGLPLALTVVGAALKDEVNVNAWKNAVGQLEKGDPDIQGYSKKVYNPLKLSYDALDPKFQYVFLLCCVYPEDANIPLEQLTYFCMGLRIFEGGIGNVEEARNRIRALTKGLKSRSLLLDSDWGDEYVRMHDVVRDVCIHIAKPDECIDGNDRSSIFSFERSKLHKELAVSNLKLLFFRAHTYLEGEFKLDNSFLEGIRDLSVICIERYSLVSLPHTTQMLRNLNALVLHSCRRVETLSVVGELVNLEILICRGCDSIEELPPEIKRLNRLKVLDLSWCGNLKRIGRGIISSLVGLEELKMLRSFKKWEAEDREEKENAGLKEVETLSKLRSLEIEIEDLALATENIRLSSKVDRFTIRFECESSWLQSSFDTYLTKQKMCLEWEGATRLGDWIEMQLLKDTECLSLIGNGANNVDLTKLEKIRCLELGRCESMRNVVTTSMDDGSGATVFPSLDHLMLFELPKLEEIWDRRVSLNCFQILKELKLDHLPALKQLWRSNQNDVGKDFLPRLEVLKIRRCEMMEGVFLWEGDGGNENNITKSFPKLKELQLEQLPKLISLCQGIEGIEFPLLRRMRIEGCGKMKGMVSNGMGSNENNSSGGSSSNAGIHGLFCPQQVSFGCLKELELDDCRNPFCSHTIDVSLFNELEELIITNYAGSRSLFMFSIARNLVNLKELWIRNCDEMVEVIKDDEEKGMSGGRQRPFLFPKLQELVLLNLPKLVRFGELKGIESIQFPKLHTLKLEDLPKLVSFCEWKCDIEFPSLSFFHGNGGIEFPLLRIIKIDRCNKMKGMVANGMSKENNSGGCNNNAANTSESQQVSFGRLKKLDTDRNTFSELEELKIFGCQGILSLFTSSMAGNLVNLKELNIGDCEEMVEVIKDEEEKGAMSGGRKRALIFPKLQTIKLLSLPNLLSFCESKGIESIKFPVLRSVKIKGCKKMKGMVANGLTSNDNNSGGSNSNLICESQQVSFGCVKELEIDWNPFCSHTIHVSLFNGLEKLTITKCAGLSLFTSSIAGNLLHLKELRIEYCHEMVQVIIDDEETCMSGGERASLFPKLHKISLSGLRKLVSFCELKCDVEFPSLSEVEINRCPDITLGSLAAPNLKSFNTDLWDDLLQVPFISPKQLSVERNEKPLNCYQIHGSVFDRLEELDIVGYKGSMSLFSSSITGNLVNLTTLTIQRCRKMVKVIEEKEEEKEKVVSGAQRTTILFPKLHKIELYKLSELVRFCEWKCDVELPSLTEVEINRCRNMKSFTLGPLNTPKLESVMIEGEFRGVKDLNRSVHQQYLSGEEKKEKKKKKNGQLEIKEEQN